MVCVLSVDNFLILFSCQVTTVVFDKTGTITHGRPSVASVSALASEATHPLPIILAAIGAAESGSEHPLATAIIRFVKEALGEDLVKAELQDYRAIAGCGLHVKIVGLRDDLEIAAESGSEAFKAYLKVKRSLPSGYVTTCSWYDTFCLYFFLLFRVSSADLAGASIDYTIARSPDHLIRGALAVNENKAVMSDDHLVDLGSTDDSNNVLSFGASHIVLIGNRRWIRDKNFIDIPEDVEAKLKAQERLGRTALLAAINGRKTHGTEVHFSTVVCLTGVLVAAFGIADTVKTEAHLTVHTLRKMGLDVILLTGDNRKTAEAIAWQAGIRRVFAEVLPSHKVTKIKKLQRQGHKVNLSAR